MGARVRGTAYVSDCADGLLKNLLVPKVFFMRHAVSSFRDMMRDFPLGQKFSIHDMFDGGDIDLLPRSISLRGLYNSVGYKFYSSGTYDGVNRGGQCILETPTRGLHKHLILDLAVIMDVMGRGEDVSMFVKYWPYGYGELILFYDANGHLLPGSPDYLPQSIFEAVRGRQRRDTVTTTLEDDLYLSFCYVYDDADVPRQDPAMALKHLDECRFERLSFVDRGLHSKKFMSPSLWHANTYYKFLNDFEGKVIHFGSGPKNCLSIRASVKAKSVWCVDRAYDGDSGEALNWDECTVPIEPDAMVLSDVAIYDDLGMLARETNVHGFNIIRRCLFDWKCKFIVKLGLGDVLQGFEDIDLPIYRLHSKIRLHNAELVVSLGGSKKLSTIMSEVAFVVNTANLARHEIDVGKRVLSKNFLDKVRMLDGDPSHGYYDFDFSDAGLDEGGVYVVGICPVKQLLDIVGSRIDTFYCEMYGTCAAADPTPGLNAVQAYRELLRNEPCLGHARAACHIACLAMERGYDGDVRFEDIIF